MTDDDGDELNAVEALAFEISSNELNRSLQSIMSTAEGKRVVFWLLDRCDVHGEAFAGAGASEVTAYQLGRQSIGRDVIGKLGTIDPRLYPTLLFDMATIRSNDLALAEERMKPRAQSESEEDDYA